MGRELKYSGVSWLGDIPKTWGVEQFRRLFYIHKDIAGKSGLNVLSVTQQGIKIKDISKNEGQIAQDYSKYQLVSPGDFVMNHMDLLTGYIDISAYDGVTSPDYRAFRAVRRNISVRYYLHIFQLCYKCRIFYQLGQGVSGFGRWRLPTEQLLLFELPLPPLKEQYTISSYLDKKCGEIDELLSVQGRIIDELKAYKQSIIAEAITKGLVPSVSMKESGIHWIGKIPQNWGLIRLKDTATFINGYAFDSDSFHPDEGIPVIRIGDISSSIDYEKCLKHEDAEFLHSYLIQDGDILIAMSGYVGKTAFVKEAKKAFVNQRVGIVRSDNNPYLKYVLMVSGFLEHVAQLNFGSVISNISSASILNYRFPFPPENERKSITDYLDEKCSEIDTLIDLKQSKIDALKAYKKSIIYEYVTGKKEVVE